MEQFAIAVHGGAGTILRSAMTMEREKKYLDALELAVNRGFEILRGGGTAVEAVENAVVELEDSPLFNAGKGSVFTHEGKHEMDAAIMEGKHLSAGAASAVKNIRNPVRLAKAIMENSEHVMMSGDGAEKFAKKMNLKFENDSYFFDQLRHDQWMEISGSEKTALDHSDKKFGTVGAVAMDGRRNLAAATSTGGMTNKQFGRIGDSPIIGSGTYANNSTCAVSCTGHGEYFIRGVVAYDVSCLIEYKGFSLKQACDFVVNDKLKKFGGEGGLIAVDALGNMALPFNCEGMYRGWKKSDGIFEVKIYS